MKINTEAIRLAIEVCGSQQKLADKVGVSQQTVCNWLNGKVSHLRYRHVMAIHKASKRKVKIKEILI